MMTRDLAMVIDGRRDPVLFLEPFPKPTATKNIASTRSITTKTTNYNAIKSRNYNIYMVIPYSKGLSKSFNNVYSKVGFRSI